MNIAIIPARYSSKRIKNKNIKFFLGRPMIELTINKLLNSRLFDAVYVSTDSIKAIPCRSYVLNLSCLPSIDLVFLKLARQFIHSF